MKQEIGGYFDLELSKRPTFLHSEGYCVNSGRNALEFILLSIPEIQKLWIPYYTCDAVLEPIKKLNIPYSFYSINEQLEVTDEIKLSANEYLLITNYFGIKDNYIKQLVIKYGDQLLVDNAQAYFCTPFENAKIIYSPRKFVGIPDGGIAFINGGMNIYDYEVDYSYDRCSHLLKRLDLGASGGYVDFKLNSRKLVNQPVRKMSGLTRALLESVDFESIKNSRVKNFNYLNDRLGSENRFDIDINTFTCPLVYPFWVKDASYIKKKMIENHIYLATYWPNVLDWCKQTDLEYDLTNNVLALPIDQRYGIKDMNIILSMI